MARAPERWLLEHDGRAYVVAITDCGLRRSITWSVDGLEVATKRTTDDRVVLDGGERGAVGLRLPELTGPARRVTWYAPDGRLGARGSAEAGVGGIDFDPEPGSRAARREAWIREHPRRYAARRAAAAAALVILPLLLFALLPRLDISWPQLTIPWPDWDLPSIPWPSIPWPDWRLPELPPWVAELFDKLQYVVPVLIALVLAWLEVRRRRNQDERKGRTRPLPREVEEAVAPASPESRSEEEAGPVFPQGIDGSAESADEARSGRTALDPPEVGR